MTVDVSTFFASVNIGCADPPVLAEFRGKVLDREVTPGFLEGSWRSVPPTRAGVPR